MRGATLKTCLEKYKDAAAHHTVILNSMFKNAENALWNWFFKRFAQNHFCAPKEVDMKKVMKPYDKFGF